jgi:serine/threonine protein kinase
MSDAPPLPVPVGELVAGKYRVERVIGRGGMGVVVAAMHEKLRQRVAIKMLLPEARASQNALARFLREARAAAAIRGEHVARVLDVGELEEGAPYIVMEYLEGRDLAAILAEGGPLPPEEAVGYILQACEAIAEAHGAGIVHRDLKPSNLFLTLRPDGTPLVKVLDFGISKALLATAGEGTLTTASSFVGSPIYAPPEQLVAAHDVDGRADIWSLGTILYESLAGRPPYVGDSVVHVASKIFHEPPASLAELKPELPEGLVTAVMKCLGKKPEDRYPDVHALAEAIAPYAPKGAISAERVARIVRASSNPTSGPSPLGASQFGATSNVVTTRSSGSRGLIVAGVAVAGVALGFVVFSGRSKPPTPAADPSTTAVAAGIAPLVTSSTPSASVTAPIAEVPLPDAGAAPSASAGAPSTPAHPVGAPPKKNPLSVGVK